MKRKVERKHQREGPTATRLWAKLGDGRYGRLGDWAMSDWATGDWAMAGWATVITSMRWTPPSAVLSDGLLCWATKNKHAAYHAANFFHEML
jgi:hypothetical protein